MRTTLTLEDDLADALKELARRSGKSFKEVVNELLRSGVEAGQQAPPPKPYRLQPVSLGGVRPGLDLVKALALADALEDEGIARKLELRK